LWCFAFCAAEACALCSFTFTTFDIFPPFFTYKRRLSFDKTNDGPMETDFKAFVGFCRIFYFMSSGSIKILKSSSEMRNAPYRGVSKEICAESARVLSALPETG
jgi:transposase